MSNKKIIWFFDDDERQVRTYQSQLNNGFKHSEEIEVIAEKAYPHKEDYLTILQNPLTVCIIVDQRLKEGGEVDHTGIELSSFLRAIDPKLPIYILTNFAYASSDYKGSEWAVEDIISKGDLADPEKLGILIARLLRRIDVYIGIIGEREKRFQRLFRKSLKEELSNEEIEELEQLNYLRTSINNLKEMPLLAHLEELLEKIQKLSDTSEK
ncbi:MAG: hypothetical protein WBB69_06750 [Anaerolineales bacterium]